MEKRIIVIGCPGSGKSYFSRQLRELLQYPLYYLDCLYWQEGWVGREDEEFERMQEDILKQDCWIVDGNYNRSIEKRFMAADLIFYFDLPTEICIENALKRCGAKREDLPEYLVEEYDPEFVEFIKDFKNTGGNKIEKLMLEHPEKKVIIFHSWEEKNAYLKELGYDWKSE